MLLYCFYLLFFVFDFGQASNAWRMGLLGRRHEYDRDRTKTFKTRAQATTVCESGALFVFSIEARVCVGVSQTHLSRALVAHSAHNTRTHSALVGTLWLCERRTRAKIGACVYGNVRVWGCARRANEEPVCRCLCRTYAIRSYEQSFAVVRNVGICFVLLLRSFFAGCLSSCWWRVHTVCVRWFFVRRQRKYTNSILNYSER